MAQTQSKERGVAKCRDCGDVYTAEVTSEGTLRPIGVATCTCGSEDFTQLGR